MNGVQVAELIVRPTERFPGQLPFGGVLENRETLREFDRIAHQVDHDLPEAVAVTDQGVRNVRVDAARHLQSFLMGADGPAL